MSNPPVISSDESLLRAFSLPSGLDKDNRATPLVFRLTFDENDVSLTRLLYESLVDFLKRAIGFPYRHLTKSDVTAGAVELLADDVTSLDPAHILLKATPSRKNPAHASIYYLVDDVVYKQPKKTSLPTDPSILGYELALASIVRKVYDLHGNVIWAAK